MPNGTHLGFFQGSASYMQTKEDYQRQPTPACTGEVKDLIVVKQS